MLELLQGILIGVMIMFFIGYFITDKKDRENLLKIAEKQQELSKDLIGFIDKNIKERVVYSSPDAPYTNEHKFEEEQNSEEEQDEDLFQVPEDLSPEQLQEQMEGTNK